MSQRTKRKSKRQTTNGPTNTIPTAVSCDSVTRDLKPVNTEKEPAARSALPDQDGSEGYEILQKDVISTLAVKKVRACLK